MTGDARTRNCPQCGRIAPAADSFCGGCGARLDAGTASVRTARASLQEVFAHLRAGEQRPATVLMTDISGFTALGEDAEPEWLFHLINEVFDELVEVLLAHGAHIDKYVGDEVVALFGVPHAQERAVERALRAFMAMRERMRALNERGAFGGTHPEIHAGINVGPVMVGPVGHRAHADYTVIGDTVNVAKRLEDEAPPGEVYVTEAVVRAVGGAFDFEPVAALHLAGRQSPVAAYRLLGTAAPMVHAEIHPTELVGRRAEFARVSALARQAAAGEQTSLFLLGPIGIGKSHLVEEWRLLEGHGFRQARVRCHVFGEHFPLLPVVELVAQLLGLRVESWPPRVTGDVEAALRALPTGAETRARLSGLLSYLAQSPGEGAQPPEELAQSLDELLEVRASEQPVCLVIEDAHWADETSRTVLAGVLGAPAARPVLALLTSREPPDAWPPESIGAETLVLSPLPREAMERLVTEWAAPRPLTPEMMRAVCDRAQGHPYFARELVEALGRQPELGVEGELRLPGTLQELFLTQLDALELPLRQLAQAASVVGEPLSHELLEAAMSDEAQLTPALLGQALSDGLLRVGPAPGQFVFGRPLLFEAAYETIPPSRRRGLHAALAAHLQRRLSALGTAAVHLAAHHAYLGYGDERALEPLLASMRLYRDQYASRQTVRTAGRALEIIGALPDPHARLAERLESLLLLARAYQVLGDLGHAEGTVAEALILAEDCPDAELVASISTTAATLHLMQGATEAAHEAFLQAQGAWERLGNEARVAHVLLGQGMCVGRLGRDDEALEIFRQAAERGGDALWVRAAALNNVGIILMSRGRYAEAEPYLLEGLRANEQEGDRRGVAHSRASLGELCYRQGHLDRAAAWLDQALELAAEIEDRQARALAAIYLARVHSLAARPSQADAALRRGAAEELEDPEVALHGRNARLDLALAAQLSGESAPEALEVEAEEGVLPDGPDQSCRNACVEHHCLRLELALVGGVGQVESLAEVLAESAASAPDCHLSAYATWLGAVAAGETPAPLEPPEETVLTERARRLTVALSGRGGP